MAKPAIGKLMIERPDLHDWPARYTIGAVSESNLMARRGKTIPPEMTKGPGGNCRRKK
jgi:hypothetical protein